MSYPNIINDINVIESNHSYDVSSIGLNINNIHNELNNIKSSYLPCWGGNMTGPIIASGGVIFGSSDTKAISLYGGSIGNNGGNLNLFAKNFVDDNGNSSYAGAAELIAQIDTLRSGLVLFPSGHSSINGMELECIVGFSSNHIQYKNGLLVCWGNTCGNTSGFTRWVYPIPFISSPVVTTAPTGDTNCQPYVVFRGDSSTNTYLDVITKHVNGTILAWGVMFIAIGRWK